MATSHPLVLQNVFIAGDAKHGRSLCSVLINGDRIAAMAEGMRRLGIQVDESQDGAVVHGGQFKGGTVESLGDHRIAMSLALAGTIADDEVVVEDVAAVDAGSHQVPAQHPVGA